MAPDGLCTLLLQTAVDFSDVYVPTLLFLIIITAEEETNKKGMFHDGIASCKSVP